MIKSPDFDPTKNGKKRRSECIEESQTQTFTIWSVCVEDTVGQTHTWVMNALVSP